MLITRRRALRLVAASALLGTCGSALARQPAGRVERIGLQLYTVRDAMAEDFDGTLERVAAIGYREVEFAGYFERSALQVRDALKNAGLVAPAAHRPIGELDERNVERAIDDAHIIGHRYLVVPYLAQDSRRALDDYRQIAQQLNRAGTLAAKADIGLAYHNHDFEFTALEGRLPYDVLLEATDPQYVSFEMDLYWITRAGFDPVRYFERYPGRFKLVHVKDSLGKPGHRVADVGAGSIDWPGLFSHRKLAGVEHYFVEHDEPVDPFASAAASYRYLRDLRF